MRRTAIVAGSAVGGALIFLICLAGAFCYKRRQRKQYEKVNQRHPQPRSLLLAGEDDFDRGDPEFTPMLLRPRGNDTGSVFSEGVWPPPSERSRLTDPLLAASAVTFDNIVDDVMGPSRTTSPTPRPQSRLRGGSGSELDEDSLYQRASYRQASYISDHHRDYSFESLINHNRRYPSYATQVTQEQFFQHLNCATSFSNPTPIRRSDGIIAGGGMKREPCGYIDPDMAQPLRPDSVISLQPGEGSTDDLVKDAETWEFV